MCCDILSFPLKRERESTKCREHQCRTLKRALLSCASCRRCIPSVKRLKSFAPHLPPPSPPARHLPNIVLSPCWACWQLDRLSQKMNSLCVFFLRWLHLCSPPLLSGFLLNPARLQIRVWSYILIHAAARPHSLRAAYTCNEAGQSDPIQSTGEGEIRSDPGYICPLVSAQFN